MQIAKMFFNSCVEGIYTRVFLLEAYYYKAGETELKTQITQIFHQNYNACGTITPRISQAPYAVVISNTTYV